MSIIYISYMYVLVTFGVIFVSANGRVKFHVSHEFEVRFSFHLNMKNF